MAKASGKKKVVKKKASPKKAAKGYRNAPVPETTGKHLVIVESPTKAKTINKYLGSDYVVMASVGHVRDLPSRAPKGVKQEVPGVDLENDFAPTYDILPAKKKTVADLKKAAKNAADVWFATDLDREGEAIAWHLAQALGVPSESAKRVVFNAITKAEIQNAFSKPRSIDENRVNAQQARRILDRIVGYQVSPLLWKKVAGGLSAGRVQSVAVRLVVEREREIEAFVPDEFWKVTAYFATDLAATGALTGSWGTWLGEAPEGKTRTLKDKLAWLSERKCLRSELVEVGGEPFKATERGQTLALAQKLGFELDHAKEWEDAKAKGPARSKVIYEGHVGGDAPDYAIRSIKTKRTTSRPPGPFITGTLQQAAANRLGYALQHTMRVAQQLYEGIDVKGVGAVGLITYMRTDSTHLSPEALSMARSYIESQWGTDYLPEKPNYFKSSNKSAQEAHEAVRPTDVALSPSRLKSSLSNDQYRLYQLIWERFLACQMMPAQWDSTTVLIESRPHEAVFKSTGRTLVFDGFYKAAGVPNGGEEAILPPLSEEQSLGLMQLDPTQQFTSPPPRYSEASLQKKLEEEGIGRPSTYAPIIQTIQDRKYVMPIFPRDKRLCATDLGMVVTDKLIEGFPTIMEVAYTRQMEAELDKIEGDHHDWVSMLREFYGPFRKNLETAHESMVHAKAETQPAPFKCGKCDAPTMYRFGRNGRFLSCTRYPDCDYAAPIDREGNPQLPKMSDIQCPVCESGMTLRVGRFGPFLGCENYPKCKGIVNVDAKKGTIKLPKPPPLLTELECSKCGGGMNLRRSKRGPWLSCSKFPKCRGRMAWSTIEDDEQAKLEKALAEHEVANPQPEIRTVEGRVVDEQYVPQVTGEDGDGQGEDDALDAA
jgi:DNA topoisomerase-1